MLKFQEPLARSSKVLSVFSLIADLGTRFIYKIKQVEIVTKQNSHKNDLLQIPLAVCYIIQDCQSLIDTDRIIAWIRQFDMSC